MFIETRYFLATLLGVLVAALIAVNLDAEPAAAATCTDSLQAKIDAAPPAGTVRADPCVYREQITITKPLTLHGQPGSEIRGSDLWTKWSYSGGYWRSARSLPPFPQTEVRCMPNTSRCLWPEQVFLDGKALTQVASEPHSSGQFAVDAGRRVLLKDDPRGHLVEVTVRRHWVLGTAAADGVTIEGFVMKHAANEGRSGAIMNRPSRLEAGGSDWTVQNNHLSDAHGAVVSLQGATGLEILDNEIFRGGQIGIHGTGPGEVIRANKVHHNNTEDFDFRWEAGGLKTAHADGVTVDQNEFYDNKGNAVWFDIDCFNNTISNNRIHHNARRGIHYELSTAARIVGNVIWENGWATPDRGDGAAIGISNSSDVEVHDNTVAWNAGGIFVIGLDREGTAWDQVHNVYIHDNTILSEDHADDPENNLALAWIQGWSNQMFEPANNNRGVGNQYWYPDPESGLARYEWMRIGYSKLADFNVTLGEEGGRYLTRNEKDAVAESRGIPATGKNGSQ
jgi:parallel beta-helix repeat protein